MMQGTGRMKGAFHPAVGLITRGNVARRCFSELKCYFWQGWGSRAGDGVRGSRGWASQLHRRRPVVLPGSWQGLLGATASSPLPSVEQAEGKGWDLLPEAFQTWTSNTEREKIAVVFAHGLEKHFALLRWHEHLYSLHVGQFSVIQTPPLRSGYCSASPYRNTTGNTVSPLIKLI